MKYMKVFVIDLDGTLLDHNKNIAENDRTRLINIQKKCDRIVLATGRNEKEANEYIEMLDLQHYNGAVILADGQYTVDFGDNSRETEPYLNTNDLGYLSKFLDKDMVIEAITPRKNFYIFFSFYNWRYWWFKFRNIYSDNVAITKQRALKSKINDIEKVTVGAISQDDIKQRILNNYDVFFVHEKKRYEIKHKGVNKAQALLRLMNKWGVKKDNVYLFGNDDNDICMFYISNNNYAVNSCTGEIRNIAAHILDDSASAVVDCICKISQEAD